MTSHYDVTDMLATAARLQKLAVESFYPADDFTAQLLRNLAR